MEIPRRIVLFGLTIPLMLGAFCGCSSTADGTGPSFVVKHLKGRARCFSAGSTNAQPLKVGDKLRPGYLVETAFGGYLDLSMRRSVTIRFYPASLTSITKATKGSEGLGDSAVLELRAGRIYIRTERSATCEVSFTNGFVRICSGLVGVYERGRIDALSGSAFVTMTGQTEATHVPQGYMFDSVSGKIQAITHYH